MLLWIATSIAAPAPVYVFRADVGLEAGAQHATSTTGSDPVVGPRLAIEGAFGIVPIAAVMHFEASPLIAVTGCCGQVAKLLPSAGVESGSSQLRVGYTLGASLFSNEFQILVHQAYGRFHFTPRHAVALGIARLRKSSSERVTTGQIGYTIQFGRWTSPG